MCIKVCRTLVLLLYICCRLLEALLVSPVSGKSVKEFVEACKIATGVNIKVEYLDRRPGDYAEVYSDPSKIRQELNWTARYTDLQLSLKIAWRWQKLHRNGYGPPTDTHWKLGGWSSCGVGLDIRGCFPSRAKSCRLFTCLMINWIAWNLEISRRDCRTWWQGRIMVMIDMSKGR